MRKLKIEGVHPLDGEYDLDISKFNGNELRTIKEIAGVRGGELGEALKAGDYDLVIAFAVIVLGRAGITADPAQLLEADVGAITVDLGTGQEAEERPPSSASLSGNGNSSVVSGAHNDPTNLSGPGSATIGDPSLSRPPVTGLPGSATSAGSDLETLAS